MRKIVLDTNFLVNCVKFKIDFFTELERICTFPYKIYVLDQTLREIEQVKPKELGLLKIFLQKIEILKSEKDYVDDELIDLSSKVIIIATQDQELKSKLKKPIIIIRQKKYLTLVE